MGQYKVPQDVESEDKLIGPFGFRQFVYLLVAAAMGATAYFLARMALALVVIPLPVMGLALVLALPLRKDQPMETYLAAIVRFLFKPRQRLWMADGSESTVTITAPMVDDRPPVKEVGGQEAVNRLSFLSQVVDTEGWATRGVLAPAPVNNTNLNDDLALSAVETPDEMDVGSTLSQTFDSMISQANDRNRQGVLAKMQASIENQPAPVVPTAQTIAAPASSSQLWQSAVPAPSADQSAPEIPTELHYEPYPTSMHQTVIQPVTMTTQTPADTPQLGTPSATQTPVQSVAAPTPPIVTSNQTTDTAAAQHEPAAGDQTTTAQISTDDAADQTSDNTNTETDTSTSPTEPAIIDNENTNVKEEIINHDGSDQDENEVVISLH
jgi:hypothetical protein